MGGGRFYSRRRFQIASAFGTDLADVSNDSSSTAAFSEEATPAAGPEVPAVRGRSSQRRQGSPAPSAPIPAVAAIDPAAVVKGAELKGVVVGPDLGCINVL